MALLVGVIREQVRHLFVFDGGNIERRPVALGAEGAAFYEIVSVYQKESGCDRGLYH